MNNSYKIRLLCINYITNPIFFIRSLLNETFNEHEKI